MINWQVNSINQYDTCPTCSCKPLVDISSLGLLSWCVMLEDLWMVGSLGTSSKPDLLVLGNFLQTWSSKLLGLGKFFHTWISGPQCPNCCPWQCLSWLWWVLPDCYVLRYWLCAIRVMLGSPLWSFQPDACILGNLVRSSNSFWHKDSNIPVLIIVKCHFHSFY